MKKLILLFLPLCLASPAFAATTHYVDNGSTGCSSPSDNNYTPATRACGSGSATVYSTVSAGVATLSSGDTLYIRGGTWIDDFYGGDIP